MKKDSDKINKNGINFLQKANKIHRGLYDYSKVKYKHSQKKICIICKTHGEFWQRPSDHLKGHGCKLCSYDLLRLGKEAFIKKANNVWGYKYNYDFVKYKTLFKRVKIICKRHKHNFTQTPDNHLKGKEGCPKCKSIKSRAITKEEFIKIANRIHSNKYNYSQIDFTTTKNKIKIWCPKHGFFNQVAGAHIYKGYGCPSCSKTCSKKEIIWLDELKIKNRQKNVIGSSGAKYRVDGVDYDKNIIYEYFGNFWHGNPRKFKQSDFNEVVKKTYGQLYRETMNRIEDLVSAGYTVVYKWEN